MGVSILLAGLLAVGCVVSVAMPAPPKPETYRSAPMTCRPLPPPSLE
jgi:hypothetical protein